MLIIAGKRAGYLGYRHDSYKYSKTLITAKVGSVRSSTTTPHSSTEKALHGESKDKRMLNIAGKRAGYLGYRFGSYKYSKILITARLGSVSSSTTTPHSSTGN